MKNISFNISGKIDQDTIDVLRALKEAADSLNIAFFIVGATARDIILQHCYNVIPRRMSLDVDIGVKVADWDQFDKLFKTLLSFPDFTESREKQRIILKNRPIDIVPFGPIANKEKRVIWPPEHEIFMSVLGFEEAYEYSIVVRLDNDPVLDIHLPTLPGLVIMKLISWDEKYPERRKDAEDILFIMDNYERAGIRDRLYESEQPLLEDSEFDLKVAGIRLLGRDLAHIADQDTLKKVNEILDNETGEQDRYRLVEHMVRGSREYDDAFEEILNKIAKLQEGIVDQ